MVQLTLTYSISFPWFRLHSLTPFYFESTIPCLILLYRATLVTKDMMENISEKYPLFSPLGRNFVNKYDSLSRVDIRSNPFISCCTLEKYMLHDTLVLLLQRGIWYRCIVKH